MPKDRRPWEDHHSYLRGLRAILEAQTKPFVVVGDYNQRVPRKRQPLSVYQALVHTFDGLAEIATGGKVPGLDSEPIDFFFVDEGGVPTLVLPLLSYTSRKID